MLVTIHSESVPEPVREEGAVAGHLDDAPDGPIMGARVEHEMAKHALIADDPGVFFTTPHFDGYAAILARLDRISAEDLEELIVEAWLIRAPKRLAQTYLDRLT